VRPSTRARRASDGPIDLRSDTVTRPTKQMRAAMADAEVGDDVLDGDPTLRELEARVAGLLGTDGAVWTPSGSMANLIALTSHLSRGDAFLAPAGAHVLDNELGTAAWLAGGMPRALPHDAGPGKISPDAGAPGRRHARAVLRAPHHAAVPGEHAQRRGRHGHRRPRSTPPSPRRPGARNCACTSTGPGSGTRRSRSGCRPRR
jgi:hypothetical protein